MNRTDCILVILAVVLMTGLACAEDTTTRTTLPDGATYVSRCSDVTNSCVTSRDDGPSLRQIRRERKAKSSWCKANGLKDSNWNKTDWQACEDAYQRYLVTSDSLIKEAK